MKSLFPVCRPLTQIALLLPFVACSSTHSFFDQDWENTPGDQISGPGTTEPTTAPGAQLFRPDRVVELRIDLSPEAWQAILDNPQAKEYQHADLHFGDTLVRDVAVRTKGNSSLFSAVREGSIRFPFKLDINRFVDGQKLDGKKKIALNSGFKDPSYVQEYLAYAMLRDLGLPAPRTGWVDLWVADQHLGLYTLVEVVDSDFVEERFDDASGDLYKPEVESGSLRDLGDDITAYRDLELKSNEESSDHSAFLTLIRVLNSDQPLADALDVDEALLYVAGSAALVNLDSYLGMAHNYYLYEQGGVFTIISWDLNEAFGNFTCRCDRAQIIDFKIDEPTCGIVADKPLVARLLGDSELRARYHGQLQDILDNHLRADVIGPRMQAAAELLRPYVLADPTRFASVEAFDRRVDTSDTALTDAASLLGWIEARRTSLQAQLDGTQATSNGGEGACPRGGGGTEPPPDQQQCAADQSCPVDQVCVTQVNRCVPDCRSNGCPAEIPTCDSTNGLCFSE